MIQAVIGLATAFAVMPGPAVTATSSLTLTYQGKQVTLTCDPVGGRHPRPGQACAALRRTGGDPAKLRDGRLVCVMVYQPVTARLDGTWQGRSVKWQRTFGNSCEMSSATGVLFDF